jgi:hypothetical protein
VEARTIPFYAASVIYLWPVVADVIGAVTLTRAGKTSRFEAFLNVMVLPFVVITAAIARPALDWMPPWYVVLAIAILVDITGFFAWWLAGRIAYSSLEREDQS